jgi:dienelactone hydrolase
LNVTGSTQGGGGPDSEAWAEKRRAELYSLLGDLPPRDRPVSARLLVAETRKGYHLETLLLDLNGAEPVPAYFVRPLDLPGKIPVILYNHAHGDNYRLGKEELLVGRPELQSPPYAELLTSIGYGVLCIDAWVFGERSHRTEMDAFKEMLWYGKILWGAMVYDSIKGIDYLLTRTDVDSNRIGTLGMSMGSTMAWWVAALDQRASFCVDICCLTDFHALTEERSLHRHGIYYYVPSLAKQFTTAGINALIAPRPHLSLAGDQDPLTPVSGLHRIDREMKRTYARLGRPHAWKLLRYPSGHQETAEMRQAIVAFLQGLPDQ